MRKIVFFAHADTAGTNTAELVVFAEGITDAGADQYSNEFGQEWANNWEPSTGEEGDDYECSEQYYEQCGWWWEDYDPAKHNGDLMGDEEGYEET